jgi:hypothetical protein
LEAPGLCSDAGSVLLGEGVWVGLSVGMKVVPGVVMVLVWVTTLGLSPAAVGVCVMTEV